MSLRRPLPIPEKIKRCHSGAALYMLFKHLMNGSGLSDEEWLFWAEQYEFAQVNLKGSARKRRMKQIYACIRKADRDGGSALVVS